MGMAVQLELWKYLGTLATSIAIGLARQLAPQISGATMRFDEVLP